MNDNTVHTRGARKLHKYRVSERLHKRPKDGSVFIRRRQRLWRDKQARLAGKKVKMFRLLSEVVLRTVK